MDLINGKGNYEAKNVFNSDETCSGTIKIEEGQVVLEINNQTIVFEEHVRLNDFEIYKGEWFESFAISEQANASRINIKSVNGNKVTFNFYITRIFSSPDIEVEINEQKGTFNVTSTGNYKASGEIEFFGNSIILSITQSTIPEPDSNQSFAFTYRK